MMKKKIRANFPRIVELFTEKIVTKLQKYGFGIWDPEKTYSGSQSATLLSELVISKNDVGGERPARSSVVAHI